MTISLVSIDTAKNTFQHHGTENWSTLLQTRPHLRNAGANQFVTSSAAPLSKPPQISRADNMNSLEKVWAHGGQ
jgi:hypothetical protein